MKKITMSILSIVALNTLVFAGGDMKHVEHAAEPVVEIPAVDDSAFYVGLGYSYMKFDGTFGKTEEISGNAYTLLAGYNFNKYIAAEGRYSAKVGDVTETDYQGHETDLSNDMSNIGIYIKPMYLVGGLTLYGLLGYGKVSYEDYSYKLSESGFQWGLGASYEITENWNIFADYTRLYDDKGVDSFLV